MKLMVQCPQVNHHLLLPLRKFMTFVSDAYFIIQTKSNFVWNAFLYSFCLVYVLLLPHSL